jgi:predicted oxidoreductase
VFTACPTSLTLTGLVLSIANKLTSASLHAKSVYWRIRDGLKICNWRPAWAVVHGDSQEATIQPHGDCLRKLRLCAGRSKMQITPQITFEGSESFDAARDVITREIARLETHNKRITGCRVTVIAPSHKHRHGTVLISVRTTSAETSSVAAAILLGVQSGGRWVRPTLRRKAMPRWSAPSVRCAHLPPCPHSKVSGN